jgi:hypothetical protein
MSYTTISNVAGMFPAFVRGVANQRPADTIIQTFIDDAAGEIDEVLNRRFATVIGTYGNFAAFIAALSTDAANVLEKINRYGAAQQLGETLATFGVSAARDLGKMFREAYDEMLAQLDARSKDGKPLESGRYDHMFDQLARTETPRPALQGIAGGEMPAGQSVSQEGMTNAFGKFDKRGT